MAQTALLSGIVQALMKHQGRAQRDRHYPGWHTAPVCGLMNDPAGFIYHRGLWHLFYQWDPFGCEHKYPCWGHWSSADLVSWTHEPVALLPSGNYDTGGCFSGSAVVNDDSLTLCYTGSLVYRDGSRTLWQCLAREKPDGGFEKYGSALGLPQGYSTDVINPKVWQHSGQWYMVLGARDENDRGCVLLYDAAELGEWVLRGVLAGSRRGGLRDAGYLWENPDFFRLGNEWVLLCCPRGIPREPTRFLNSSPGAYLVGQFDYESKTFRHKPQLYEADAGFEFYAPQTTLASDGRRIMVALMGGPGGEEMQQPTVKNGWLHQMTCPRELTLQNGQLYQRPVKELEALRGTGGQWSGEADNALELSAGRLEVIIRLSGPLILNFSKQLIFSYDGHEIRLSRRSLISGDWQHRYWQGEVTHLHIFTDHSSAEIFINDGEAVMSSRYFPQQTATLVFRGLSPVQLSYWQLNRAEVA